MKAYEAQRRHAMGGWVTLGEFDTKRMARKQARRFAKTGHRVRVVLWKGEVL